MAYHLKRVNAHAERRELSTSVLGIIVKFPNYQKARIKSGRSVLCPIIFYLSIGIQYFVKLDAKIINFCETQAVNRFFLTKRHYKRRKRHVFEKLCNREIYASALSQRLDGRMKAYFKAQGVNTKIREPHQYNSWRRLPRLSFLMYYCLLSVLWHSLIRNFFLRLRSSVASLTLGEH